MKLQLHIETLTAISVTQKARTVTRVMPAGRVVGCVSEKVGNARMRIKLVIETSGAPDKKREFVILNQNDLSYEIVSGSIMPSRVFQYVGTAMDLTQNYFVIYEIKNY